METKFNIKLTNSIIRIVTFLSTLLMIFGLIHVHQMHYIYMIPFAITFVIQLLFFIIIWKDISNKEKRF